MDKKLRLKLNGNRGVVGVLRGFDQFLNLVLDEAHNDVGPDKEPLGMVVVRGNSVQAMEALEQHHVRPTQLCQMIKDRAADHATSDHDSLGMGAHRALLDFQRPDPDDLPNVVIARPRPFPSHRYKVHSLFLPKFTSTPLGVYTRELKNGQFRWSFN